MTPAEFAEAMKNLAEMRDHESAHDYADDLLEKLIAEQLPEFAEGMKHYSSMVRWFA